MKYLFPFFTAIVFFTACNNAGDTGQTITDTLKTIDSSSGTVAVQPTSSFPSDLTLDEMKDDSVFSDKSQPASWTAAGIDDPVSFKRFLKKLQRWVAEDQKDSVLSAIAFPLANPRVKDKEAFLVKYDIYFNDKVKIALKNQNLRQIFRKDRGAMIGNGELWLGQIQGGFAIIAINYK